VPRAGKGEQFGSEVLEQLRVFGQEGIGPLRSGRGASICPTAFGLMLLAGRRVDPGRCAPSNGLSCTTPPRWVVARPPKLGRGKSFAYVERGAKVGRDPRRTPRSIWPQPAVERDRRWRPDCGRRLRFPTAGGSVRFPCSAGNPASNGPVAHREDNVRRPGFPDVLRGNSLHQRAGNLFELAGKLQGRAGRRIVERGKCERALKAEQASFLVPVGWQGRAYQQLCAQRGRLPALLDCGDD
jgi:hypothetical protein